MPSPIAHDTPVFLTEEIRRIEALAASMPDPPQLMERAGLAAGELARTLARDSGEPVLILAGPGNNGGDALVVARHLRQWWYKVHVVFTGDARKLSADAAAAYAAWRDAGGNVEADVPPNRDWDLIVDGLFGIGLQREVTGRYAELVSFMNRSSAPVLAIDVPSGLESDSGRVLGSCVRAQHTITFIGLKPGLLTLDGPDHCGELHLAMLGLDAAALLPPHGSLVAAGVLRDVLKPRALNTHKGDYGSVGVVGGAHGMVGAALLAGRAALKLGAGRVYVGLIAQDAPLVDMAQPELMLRSADEVLKLPHLAILAVGPGLGQSPDAAFYLQWALESSLPLVIDADGLNLIGAMPSLRDMLEKRGVPTLLTPHPAEAARLLGSATREVQHDRVAAALKLAGGLASHVVLKGAGSVCASPDGSWAINTSGNPGMASAGMGDVLTGIIAALLAQGVDAKTALHAGVHLHGAAADAAVVSGAGPVGLAAGELIDAARRLVNEPKQAT
jgi:ADP-dependent NAD(P)H-hydrate dehydratase / NAD(P)H-hydrate epimerase